MESKETTKSPILIAHIADTHLRDSQYATARRGIDFYTAFEHTVKSACEKADLLVLVGDIFDRPRPSPRVIGQLMKIDNIIKAYGKTMFAVTGNHDWCDPTWLSTLFPERSPTDLGIVPIDGETASFKGYTFTGIHPHNAGGFRRDMASIEVQARGADVVLYHGLVDGVVPFYAGLDNPLSYKEFPIAKENKAWLLGDIHIRGHVSRSRPGGGDCIVAYPGSTEMCSASEPTDKGFYLWKLDKDDVTLEEVVATPIRPFLTGNIETEEDLDKFIAKVEPVADQHPVVVVHFNRELTQTINRLHSMLDAQRAIIRCYPLPAIKGVVARETDDGEEELGMDHFVTKLFSQSEDHELQATALALLHRGDTDADGIIAEYIEKELASTGVREDD